MIEPGEETPTTQAADASAAGAETDATEAAEVIEPRRPPGRWWTLGLPLGMSLVIHGFVAVVSLVIAWNVLSPSGRGARDVFLSLDDGTRLDARTDKKDQLKNETPEKPSAMPSPSAARAMEGEGDAAPNTKGTGAVPTRTMANESGSIGAALSSAAPPIGVSFAGLSAQRARSVVYVVDASGPMVSTLPQVMKKVKESVDRLAPTQRFDVILFGEQPDNNSAPTAVSINGTVRYWRFSPRLMDATARNRAALSEFLSKVEARGKSNPLDGLRGAIAMKPQVIFLLARSIPRTQGGQWESGMDAILGELNQLNPVDPATGRRGIIIKTIQFFDDDPTGIMQAIAMTHGGGGSGGNDLAGPRDYRVMRRDDLGP